ncbi:MAG: DUF2752 domain-containing protein [Byssovorax sp.]
MHPRVAQGLQRLRPVAPVLVIGALLALIPYPTCLVRLALGVPCPACGLTRAGLALAHGDLAAAQRFHPLAAALLLVTIATSIAAFLVDDPTWRRLVRIVTSGAGVALILVWALRFAGFFGGPVPR